MSPVLASSDPISGNLLAELSTFVGREVELEELTDLQARTRLLTLVGPGGVGKSRLAVRLAATLRRNQHDGIWLVDLAHVSCSAHVPQAVAEALDVHEQAGRSWDTILTERLRARHVLLVLDNCDHVLTPTRELVDMLLLACPELSILVTSRQQLAALGERVWRVPPLAMSEAVHLFVERAGTRAQGFRLTERNHETVAQICRRLDGLPLALELVAARVESMDLVDIAGRLESGLALRVSGHRGAPLRQQTLRATIDWSYAMLDDQAQLLLRRLAVFASVWTLTRAQAICADAFLPRSDVARLLGRLVSSSLVSLEFSSDGSRFALLETLRAYLLQKLDASDDGAHVRQRHAAYMLEIVELADPELLNVAHIAVLERERADVRAALNWALTRHDAELGLRLAIGTHGFWFRRGWYSAARCWLELFLAQPEAQASRLRAEALRVLALFLGYVGEYASADHRLAEAREHYEARGDQLGIALNLRRMGSLAMWRGELARARPLLAEAAHRLQSLGSHGQLAALFNAGIVALELGEPERTVALADECAASGQRWDQTEGLAKAVVLRALVAASRGAFAQAELLLRERLEMRADADSGLPTVFFNSELGHALLDQGKFGHARAAFGAAIQDATDAGERLCLSRALEGVARCAARGRPTEAVRLAVAAAHMRVTLGAISWPRDARRVALWLPKARRELGEKAFAAAWSAGQAMSQDDARALADAAISSPEPDAPPNSRLSPRETQLALLVARGFSTRQIATEMIISVATVRVHVDHILTKLGMHSRTQIARWVSQEGLLSNALVPWAAPEPSLFRGKRIRTRNPPSGAA